MAPQGEEAASLKSLNCPDLVYLGIAPGQATEHEGLARPEYLPRGRSLHRQQQFLVQEAFAGWKVKRVQSQLVARRFWQRQAGVITVHDAPQSRQDGPQHGPQVQIRHGAVGDLEQQLQSIVVALQLHLRKLCGLEVQRAVDRQCDLIRYEGEKADFFLRIGVETGAAES